MIQIKTNLMRVLKVIQSSGYFFKTRVNFSNLPVFFEDKLTLE